MQEAKEAHKLIWDVAPNKEEYLSYFFIRENGEMHENDFV